MGTLIELGQIVPKPAPARDSMRTIEDVFSRRGLAHPCLLYEKLSRLDFRAHPSYWALLAKTRNAAARMQTNVEDMLKDVPVPFLMAATHGRLIPVHPEVGVTKSSGVPSIDRDKVKILLPYDSGWFPFEYFAGRLLLLNYILAMEVYPTDESGGELVQLNDSLDSVVPFLKCLKPLNETD